MADDGSGLTVAALSDDLIAACFQHLDDCTLRLASSTCQRWAALLRERGELWHTVHMDLPPKRSRGRDRRNSYTTPCALNVARLAAWLQRRRFSIIELHVGLLYPDALALLPQLLQPAQAPALRALVLAGSCSDWPYLWIDWRWLAGLTALERLELRDALPGMAELLLPPSLTELHTDRVGEGEAENEGWDELPSCLSRLTALHSITLGSAATYLLQAEEESAWEPLRAARGLRELRLPDGAISAVPDVVARFAELTLLSFRGCSKLEAFGDACIHKPDPFLPLASLRRLLHLDFSCCALEWVPSHLGSLPLRTLLLAGNRLRSLPACAFDAAHAVAALASTTAGTAGGSGAALALPIPLLPLDLMELDVSGNLFGAFPVGGLTGLTRLTCLDISRCWHMPSAPADWRRLLGALPALCLLRHSCALLAAEARGYGGAAGLAEAVGGCTRLCLQRVPAPPLAGQSGSDSEADGPFRRGSGGAKRARSTSSLEHLEEAAAVLLQADQQARSSGGSGGSSGAGGSGSGWQTATLAHLAATAADRGSGGGAVD